MGSALTPQSPVMTEDGHPTTAGQAMETHPPYQANAVIRGTFTLHNMIIKNEHFRAGIGFRQGTAGTIQYQIIATGANGSQTLAEGTHSYNGQIVPVDVDLSPSAGATQLALRVTAVGSTPSDSVDDVIWIHPRIEEENAPQPTA